MGYSGPGCADTALIWGYFVGTPNDPLKTLLEDFPEGFSMTPGWTLVIQHEIPTEVGAVVRTVWRPILWKRWEVVNQEVEDMLHLGVIEPSHSEWRSPIVLVPKPDGTVRFCIDF